MATALSCGFTRTTRPLERFWSDAPRREAACPTTCSASTTSIDQDLLVLPCVCFDPLWPHHDRRDRYYAAPFDRFEDFFRRFEPEFLHNGSIRSYGNFFPGAFTYHGHNFWDAWEDPNSYLGLFNQEFDTILKDRLAKESTTS